MNLKKNVFSYLIWLIYSAAICICLLGISGSLSSRAGYPEAYGYGAGGLWLLFGGLTVFLMHKLLARADSAEENSRIKALVTESFFAVLLFAAGIFLRVNGLAAAGENEAYFEAAKVAEGLEIPRIVHGAVYVYLQLLHFVFVVFGNKLLAGIWLQIILQIITGIFLYLAVRRLAGATAALTMLAFLMTGPLMVKEALLLSPRPFFLAVYAIGLFACALCISGRRHPAIFLIAGMGAAVVTYLDIAGISLLAFTLCGLLMRKSGEDRPFSRRLFGAFVCLAGSGAGFLLIIGLDALSSSKEVWAVLTAWQRIFLPSGFVLPMAVDTTVATVDVLILILLMTVGIFSYWCTFRTERQTVWIIPAVTLIVIQLFGMTGEEMKAYSLLYILFTVLAGIGLGSVFRKDAVESPEESGEENVAEAGLEVELSTETKGLTDEDKREEKKTQIKAKREIEIEDLSEEEEKPEPEEKEFPQIEEEQEPEEEDLSDTANEAEKPKVKLLYNPLPLPKKHVKKVMDYDRKFEEMQDDFDLCIDENDDYDI